MDQIPPELMKQLRDMVTSDEDHLKNISEIQLILSRPASPLNKKAEHHVEVKFFTNPTQRRFYKTGDSLLECIIQVFKDLKQPLKEGASE